MTKEELISQITSTINANGNQDITGTKLQEVLVSIVDTLYSAIDEAVIGASPEDFAELILQSLGTRVDATMSQKAITDALTALNYGINAIPVFARIERTGAESVSLVNSSTELPGEIVYVTNEHPYFQEGFYWKASDNKYYTWFGDAHLYKVDTNTPVRYNKLFECAEDGKQYVIVAGSTTAKPNLVMLGTGSGSAVVESNDIPKFNGIIDSAPNIISAVAPTYEGIYFSVLDYTFVAKLGTDYYASWDSSHLYKDGPGVIESRLFEYNKQQYMFDGKVLNLLSDMTKIADGAVTTEKLADKSVTKEKLSQAVSSKLAYSRFRIHRQGLAAYATLANVDFPILRGCYVKNNGVDMILGSDSSLTQRKNLFSGEIWCCEFDVNLIRTFSVAGDVDMDINIPAPIEVDWESMPNITTEKIADGAVTTEKTDFFEKILSENLLDISKCTVGYYIYANGELLANNAYAVTDYIEIPAGAEFMSLWKNTDAVSGSGYAYLYDSNKNKLFGKIQNTNDKSSILISGSGAKYIRFSLPAYNTNKDYYQVLANNSAPSGYTPYSETIKIKEEYLPEKKEEKELKYFFLPKHIYVAAGRTIELYYEQMLLNSHLYNIQAQCSIGAALERKFQIIGDTEHLGNYTLAISIYDNNGNKLKEATSTIHIVSNEITNNVALLPIGDSLTNQKPWLAELANLSDNKIISLGTRGSIAQPHEGRSGAAVSTYMSASGNPVYSFDHSYIGVGSDSDIFSTAQAYSIGDYCKYENSIYVFIAEHPAGAWNSSHVYNITEGNPFYDWETKTWSFTKYKQRNNINPDVIMIYLGTNGINLTPETNNNGALGIKNLIDKIRLEDANTPIIVVNTIFRSGQNGIGKQGNTDGYTAQSEYKFNADRKVLLLAKALDELIGNYPNVYLCPVGFTHDSKYNFGNIKKEVNPRLTDTSNVWEVYPNESVHPQNAGYMQMADCMFSTICAI